MISDLIDLGVSAPEKIVRTLVVYLALAVLLRVAGKRDLAQLNTMDLVVVLLLSNVVQNAVIGPDDSLLGGLLGAAVLVGFNALANRVVRMSDTAHRLLEGVPTVLASDGRWDERALDRVGLRASDVEAAVRRQNANGVQDTERVTLEPGGAILTQVRAGSQAASRDDVARLEAKVDALLARA